MAWRPPKGQLLYNTWVEIRQVSRQELKDLIADDDDEENDGAWRFDTKTIYLLKTLRGRRKNEVYSHELGHALVDLADTR